MVNAAIKTLTAGIAAKAVHDAGSSPNPWPALPPDQTVDACSLTNARTRAIRLFVDALGDASPATDSWSGPCCGG